MNHGSLFSGIGGFDLASEWMGWDNKFHCEWNPFGQRVLKYYWPNAISYGDITKTDFSIWRGKIDILTGGFPCQPYSTAGKRLGKEDDRHLWPEMLRAIREIQPRYIVGENVSGITNWNGGMVFEEVQAEMEAEGYEVTPFILPACAVNAPHRRDRVWFIAYSLCSGHGRESQETRSNKFEEWEVCQNIGQHRNKVWSQTERCCRTTSNTESRRKGTIQDKSQKTRAQEGNKSLGGVFRISHSTNTDGFGLWGQSDRIGGSRLIDQKSKINDWEDFPTQSPICNGDDGLPSELDGITFSKWRSESIKGGGNAIVPQVALQIFKGIEQFDKTEKCH